MILFIYLLLCLTKYNSTNNPHGVIANFPRELYNLIGQKGGTDQNDKDCITLLLLLMFNSKNKVSFFNLICQEDLKVVSFGSLIWWLFNILPFKESSNLIADKMCHTETKKTLYYFIIGNKNITKTKKINAEIVLSTIVNYPVQGKECKKCGKNSHFERVCRSKTFHILSVILSATDQIMTFEL